MEYYFAIIDGKQAGPMSKEQLASAGVTTETMVWRAGMADWVKACSLPELNDIFMDDSAFGGYARPEEQLNPYAGDNGYGRSGNSVPPHPYQGNYGSQRPNPYNQFPAEPIEHTNWMAPAIIGLVLGTLFSCIGFIFGVIAVVKASNANKYYANGLKAEGDVANSSAKTMSIIALVLAGIGILGTIFLRGWYLELMQTLNSMQ